MHLPDLQRGTVVIAHCNGSGRIRDLRALSFLSELHSRGDWGRLYLICIYKYKYFRRV